MLEPRKYKLHLFLSYLLGYYHKFSFYIYVKLHKTLFHTVNTHLRLSACLFLLVFFIPSCISGMLSGIIFLPSEELCGFFQCRSDYKFSQFLFIQNYLYFTFIFEGYFLLDAEFSLQLFSFSTLKMSFHCHLAFISYKLTLAHFKSLFFFFKAVTTCKDFLFL